MLAPPYSSGTVIPSTPISPILRHRSMGNWSLRSISAARGAISLCAKACTVSRRASRSSPRPKSRPGSCCMEVSLVPDAFAPGDRHEGGGHGRHQLFAACVVGEGAALGDGDRAPRLHDQAFHAEALALRGCEQVD